MPAHRIIYSATASPEIKPVVKLWSWPRLLTQIWWMGRLATLACLPRQEEIYKALNKCHSAGECVYTAGWKWLQLPDLMTLCVEIHHSHVKLSCETLSCPRSRLNSMDAFTGHIIARFHFLVLRIIVSLISWVCGALQGFISWFCERLSWISCHRQCWGIGKYQCQK